MAGDEENASLWAVLFFIPYIEIVAYIMLIIAWVKNCRKLDKSPWLTLLFLIPFVHCWAIGYLAIG